VQRSRLLENRDATCRKGFVTLAPSRDQSAANRTA